MATSCNIVGMTLTHWPAIVAVIGASLVQTPPVPKPFPQPGQPPATTGANPPVVTSAPQAATPAQPPQAPQAPASICTPATVGAPIYPTAEFLESFDAGRGQRYCIFATNAAYTEIVAYYKNVMKSGGRTVFEAPAMQQWELGKFQDQTMSFPPSVTVKDYAWGGSPGYLYVSGTTEKRFKTIIQIVPLTAPIK